MGSSLDSLCWVVPNLLQPIIVLFHLLAATCMSDAYIYTIRGVEVSIGAMGYKYNKQPVYGDLPDWGYDLPSNIDPTIPPLKKVLLAHLVAGIILGLYWFFSLVITLVARSKKKKSEKWSLREWQLLYYQSKTLFLLIPPFLVTAAMFSLDMAYLTVAMQTLNERLPKGTPPILTLGPYGVLIFVGHALSATWGLWIFVIAFYFRGADWKEDSMYQRKKHEQYLEDVEKKKARDKQKAYEAAKKKGKSKK